MYITYKITCIITGKYYIGSHKTDNVQDGYMGSGKFIRDSIAQYGAENHVKEVLGIFKTRAESLQLEHSLIKEKKAKEKELCLNKTSGGYSFDYINTTRKNVYVRTQETLDKQRSILAKAQKVFQHKMETEPEYAKKYSQIRSDAIKKYLKTHPNPFKGKKHTNEAKAKISATMKVRQAGTNNNQYGTYWITNGVTNAKWSDKRGAIPDGYHKGRTGNK